MPPVFFCCFGITVVTPENSVMILKSNIAPNGHARLMRKYIQDIKSALNCVSVELHGPNSAINIRSGVPLPANLTVATIACLNKS